MATYADIADLKAGFPDDLGDSAIKPVTEQEILDAQEDINSLPLVAGLSYATISGYITQVDVNTGLKLKVSTLLPYRKVALSRAVGEQVIYRRLMGNDFLRRPQYAKVSGEGFSQEGVISKWAPRAIERLSNVGMLNYWGTTWGVDRRVDWQGVEMEDMTWSDEDLWTEI